MSSDSAPPPRPRGTQSFTCMEDTLTQLKGGKTTEADEPPGYARLKALIANAERYRLWRRAAERDAEYLRERMASIHTWMDPEAQWIERECDELYAKTLASLPPECRATFVAVREDGRSYAEAAKERGISVKMVGKHISQAQAVFRLALREYGITPPPEKRAKRDRIAFALTSADARKSIPESPSAAADRPRSSARPTRGVVPEESHSESRSPSRRPDANTASARAKTPRTNRARTAHPTPS
jgi:Sigma-70, region 4